MRRRLPKGWLCLLLALGAGAGCAPPEPRPGRPQARAPVPPQAQAPVPTERGSAEEGEAPAPNSGGALTSAASSGGAPASAPGAGGVHELPETPTAQPELHVGGLRRWTREDYSAEGTLVHAFWQSLPVHPRRPGSKVAHVVVDTQPRLCVELRFSEAMRKSTCHVSLRTPLGSSSVSYYVEQGDEMLLSRALWWAYEPGPVDLPCRTHSLVEHTPSGWRLGGAQVFPSALACLSKLDSAAPLALHEPPEFWPSGQQKPTRGSPQHCWGALFRRADGEKVLRMERERRAQEP